LITEYSANGAVAALSQEAARVDVNFNSTGLAQAVLNAFDQISNDPSFADAFLAHGSSSFSWGIGYDFSTDLVADSHIGFNIGWDELHRIRD
jgi:hypothetical protein